MCSRALPARVVSVKYRFSVSARGFCIPPQCAWEETRSLLQTNEFVKPHLTSKFRGRIPSALILEDGTVFHGYSFGATRSTTGEAVFSTSMVGYPETLTDPSYRGQVLCLTYPLVGNYGVPSYEERIENVPVYFESENIQSRGLVVHELCETPSHRLSVRSLDKWLSDENVPGICGIDTRRLARVLRERGVMLSAMATGDDIGVIDVTSIPDPNKVDLVKEVSISRPITYGGESKNKIVLIDCGVKSSIIRNIRQRGVAVIRVPYDTPASEILDYGAVGVVVSNGPGDPKTCKQTIQTIRDLIDAAVPVLGICLGTQLIALAAGADTYKMKYGHRSQNQPVIDMETNRCYITTQNHGFAVDKPSLEKAGLRVWFANANDQSIEGLKHPDKPCWGVQWHPEACPGPTDTEYIFDFFLKEANRLAAI